MAPMPFELALKALGVGAGDRVATAANAGMTNYHHRLPGGLELSPYLSMWISIQETLHWRKS
jgi:hypothetical protein